MWTLGPYYELLSSVSKEKSELYVSSCLTNCSENKTTPLYGIRSSCFNFWTIITMNNMVKMLMPMIMIRNDDEAMIVIKILMTIMMITKTMEIIVIIYLPYMNKPNYQAKYNKKYKYKV